MNRFRLSLLFLLTFAVLTFGGCTESDRATQPSIPDIASLPTAQLADSIDGVTGQGAHYALYRPANWNGRLVLVAHGYYSPVEMPAPPGTDEFFISSCKGLLLASGFAVAYSSYRELGWCVKEAQQDLEHLNALFVQHFGRPDRTYLAGVSMGGLVVTALAEKHPNRYAGVLAESGPMRGGYTILQQVYGVRVVFDYYFPGIVPGSPTYIPEDVDVWAV